jgi:cysteine desulfurase/selenocysteine lyase
MTAVIPSTGAGSGSPPIDPAAEWARTLAGRRGPAAGHHLNAAGASLATVEVLETVTDHLRLEAEIGGYEAAGAELTRLDAIYGSAAALLGAASDDIALVESASVAWQRIVDAMRLGPGDRVLATRSTYVSSALHLLELARSGVVVDIVPADSVGRVDLDALAELLGRPAALLAATHIPTSSGVVEPVAEIGALARRAGVPYLLDATQSVGHVPVDVGAIGCDGLVTTGRKFLRAPRGTGLLYVAPDLRRRLRPTAPDVRGAIWSADRDFELRGSARRFESWEAAHALRLGLGQALAESSAAGPARVRDHVVALARDLRARLTEEIPDLLLAEPIDSASGIVTFICEGEEPQVTLARLTRGDCHAVTVPAGHGRWDLEPRGLASVVRVSFHVYNDSDDVSAVLAALARAHPALRSSAGRPASPASEPPVLPTAPAEIPSARVSAPSSFRGSRECDGAEVIVIGAGIHGLSAAWQLARRGASVLVLDRLAPGHTEGSSHGHTRMIRRAYPAPVWYDLLDRAYASWAELEQACGHPLITVTGGLYAHRSVDGGALTGPGCEQIDAAAARRLAPALELGDDYAVVHDPGAGVIDAAGAMVALGSAGAAHGARTVTACPVLGLREDGDGVDVITPRGTFRAAQVLVAAGPWTGALVPELAPALEVQRIVNVHLRSVDPAAVTADSLGVFSIAFDGRLLYGVPGIGGHGLKVGLDDGSVEDPDRPAAPVRQAEIDALRAAVRRFLPRGDGEPEAVVACRYTVTPTRRFAVGPLPGRPRVLVAAACSGHGFKFGPALGEGLADLVEGTDRPDLAFLDPAGLIPVAVGRSR